MGEAQSREASQAYENGDPGPKRLHLQRDPVPSPVEGPQEMAGFTAAKGSLCQGSKAGI